MLLPDRVEVKLGMILVGIVGLFFTRTLYDKSIVKEARQFGRRADRDNTSMLSAMESGVSSGVDADAHACSSNGVGAIHEIDLGAPSTASARTFLPIYAFARKK